jgi:chromate transporter
VFFSTAPARRSHRHDLGAAIILTRATTEPWQYAIVAAAAILLLVLRRGVVLALLIAAAAGVLIALASGALAA